MSVIYDWEYDFDGMHSLDRRESERIIHETQFQEPTMDMLTMTLQSVQLDRGDTNKYLQ